MNFPAPNIMFLNLFQNIKKAGPVAVKLRDVAFDSERGFLLNGVSEMKNGEAAQRLCRCTGLQLYSSESR